MTVLKNTPTKTPQKSKIQQQKRKEITNVQILLIIIAVLIGIFIQNQETIMKDIAKQKATLFQDENQEQQEQQITITQEDNIQDNQNAFEVYYQQEKSFSNEENSKISHQTQEVKQTPDIRPMFKKLLEDRIEKIFTKKQKAEERIVITQERIIVTEIVPPQKNWTQVNLNDISLNGVKDKIIKQKSKSVNKGSQFYHGQMSFIVSLKASAHFIQNALFLEHTMIEQMGKGKQISKIIDNSVQCILKNAVGFDGLSKFVNAQRGVNKQIHGIAALKSATKTIRTQFTVDLIYTLVETGIDFSRFVRGSISGKMFTKNIFTNLVSTTGSTFGFTYGTIKFQNQLGGIMGSIAGAFSSNLVSQVVYTTFFSDEPDITEEEIVTIFKEVIYNESVHTDLNMNEMELLIQKVQNNEILKITSEFEEEKFKQELTDLVKTFIAQIIDNREKVVKA